MVRFTELHVNRGSMMISKCATPLILLFSIIIFYLSGCAPLGTGPAFSLKPPPQDKTVVYHYRVNRFTGSALSFLLFSNNEYVTQIGNGGYYPQVVESGFYEYKHLRRHHNFGLAVIIDQIDNALAKVKSAHTLNVEAGRLYFIRWDIKFGGKLAAQAVSKETALKELYGLQRFDDLDKEKAEKIYNNKQNE